MEPKAQCRACLTYWDIGIVYCTCGHFFRDDTAQKLEVHLVRAGSLLHPKLLHQEGPTTRSQVREETRLLENSTRQNQLQKKCQETRIRYENIHDRFIHDTWFRKTMLWLSCTEEVLREMDKLANEDHTHIATEEDSTCIVAIGGYVRILWVPTRCP